MINTALSEATGQPIDKVTADSARKYLERRAGARVRDCGQGAQVGRGRAARRRSSRRSEPREAGSAPSVKIFCRVNAAAVASKSTRVTRTHTRPRRVRALSPTRPPRSPRSHNPGVLRRVLRLHLRLYISPANGSFFGGAAAGAAAMPPIPPMGARPPRPGIPIPRTHAAHSGRHAHAGHPAAHSRRRGAAAHSSHRRPHAAHGHTGRRHLGRPSRRPCPAPSRRPWGAIPSSASPRPSAPPTPAAAPPPAPAPRPDPCPSPPPSPASPPAPPPPAWRARRRP